MVQKITVYLIYKDLYIAFKKLFCNEKIYLFGIFNNNNNHRRIKENGRRKQWFKILVQKEYSFIGKNVQTSFF